MAVRNIGNMYFPHSNVLSDVLSTDLIRANIVTATDLTIKNCQFSSIEIAHMEFWTTMVSDTVIHNTTIIDGCIESCKFINTCFDNALFHEVKFNNCEFINCAFNCTIYTFPESFNGCIFTHCSFSDRFDSTPFAKNNNIFSQCPALFSQSDFLKKYFQRNEDNTGYIVYKIFDYIFSPCKEWNICRDSIIEENCDMNRFKACSYGINVATLSWAMRHASSPYSEKSIPIWKCEINDDWLADVCVPYESNGKIRCGKLKLLDIVDLS